MEKSSQLKNAVELAHRNRTCDVAEAAEYCILIPSYLVHNRMQTIATMLEILGWKNPVGETLYEKKNSSMYTGPEEKLKRIYNRITVQLNINAFYEAL